MASRLPVASTPMPSPRALPLPRGSAPSQARPGPAPRPAPSFSTWTAPNQAPMSVRASAPMPQVAWANGAPCRESAAAQGAPRRPATDRRGSVSMRHPRADECVCVHRCGAVSGWTKAACGAAYRRATTRGAACVASLWWTSSPSLPVQSGAPWRAGLRRPARPASTGPGAPARSRAAGRR